MSNIVVAIDGPAGAGKSTVAQLAAKELNCTYIDTGAMYRAVAWKTLQTKKPVTDELIADVVKDIQVELSYIDGKTQVKVDGTDVTGEIRTPEVTAIVSQVAALGPVRVKMVELQRQMASQSNVLMDGRDIATSVLPNANVKIFLTASIEERARRRFKEMQAKKPVTDELIADVVKDIQVELSYIDGKTQVKVDGTDVTGEIRTPEVTAIVSQVAALGPVRVKMVELQRQMASQSNVLMDGRDIATSVLPNANVKIFLTASIEERARRRFKEMQAKGYDVKLEELQKDIAARDKADSERKISPLVQAPDAELLDTSHMSIEEVVAAIVARCKKA